MSLTNCRNNYNEFLQDTRLCRKEFWCPPQSGRYEVTRPAGGVEDSDARPVLKEERLELENLVVLVKGLRRRSACKAEAGDEGRREPEATDLCGTPFNVSSI